jgi:hypothetical protein
MMMLVMNVFIFERLLVVTVSYTIENFCHLAKIFIGKVLDVANKSFNESSLSVTEPNP